MQRLAERCSARTPFDLLEAVRELWGAVERMVDWDAAINKVLDRGKDVPLPRPKYVPVAAGKAMFEWDAGRGKARWWSPRSSTPRWRCEGFASAATRTVHGAGVPAIRARDRGATQAAACDRPLSVFCYQVGDGGRNACANCSLRARRP
jgi:hypothetical protein